MTLLQVIKRIEAVAAAQPSVNAIVRDNILKLNETPDMKYGAFVWTQGQHTESAETDIRTFRFTFFYVDRCVRGHGNETEVQSVGMETLGNIIRELADGFDIREWTIDTWTQPFKFADDCAGAYASVTLYAVRGGSCSETFADGNGIMIV